MQQYYCYQIGSQVSAIVRRHCKCCTSWLWPTFTRSRNLMWISWIWWKLAKKILKYDFYRGWCLPSNGTIAIGLLLDLQFQGQTFSCYAFVLHICTGIGCHSTDLPRFARPWPWSCSCYLCPILGDLRPEVNTRRYTICNWYSWPWWHVVLLLCE